MTERPDGTHSTTFGWVLVAIGVLAIFIGAGAETFEGMIWGAVIANLGIGLGIILISLGYLVRAIWFLPGREGEISINEDRPTSDIESDGFHFCDWCHLGLYAPDVACSKQTEEEILADVSECETIKAACRKELEKRGLV